jgi:hypothetical protein
MSTTTGGGGGADPRRSYLLKVASHIHGLNLVEEKLPNVGALGAFCAGQAPVLAIGRLDQVFIAKKVIKICILKN